MAPTQAMAKVAVTTDSNDIGMIDWKSQPISCEKSVDDQSKDDSTWSTHDETGSELFSAPKSAHSIRA
jgi:hypothetical protein